jgi:hypothetical protein
MLDGIQVSLGLNAEEEYLRDLDTEIQLVVKKYYVQDIGDLSYCNAYEVYDGTGHTLTGNVIFDELANFELQKDDKIILSFSNGIPNRNSY